MLLVNNETITNQKLVISNQYLMSPPPTKKVPKSECFFQCVTNLNRLSNSSSHYLIELDKCSINSEVYYLLIVIISFLLYRTISGSLVIFSPIVTQLSADSVNSIEKTQLCTSDEIDYFV